MTTGYQVNGVDLAAIFGPKGTHTAAATGYLTEGTDLNAQLLALADGQALSYATGIEVKGADLNTIFGVPATTLPINGQSFVATAHETGSTFTCGLEFSATTSGWKVVDESPGTTLASGTIPSGAVSVKYANTITTGTATITNTASSLTALSASALVTQTTNSRLNTQPTVSGISEVTVQFANSSGAIISTTSFSFRAAC